VETDFATKSVSTPSQEPEVSNRSTASKARRSKPLPSIYRVRNWAAYDQALKQRGSVTIWFSSEALQAWGYQGPAQRGAPFVYSDVAIETALTLRLIYYLAIRQTEGFVESVLDLMGLGSVGAGSFDPVAAAARPVDPMAHPSDERTDPRSGR
jgi:hypothetical protein